MSGYSQKDDAQKISEELESVINRAATLGREACEHGLSWPDNPFRWGSDERKAWNEGYSDAEAKSHAKSAPKVVVDRLGTAADQPLVVNFGSLQPTET